MYELPNSFDPSTFNGRILDVVSFSANSIVLVFEADLRITIGGAYAHEIPGEAPILKRADMSTAESRLMGLAGKRVTQASSADRKTLVLEFEDGRVVKCIGDCDEYECYHIVEAGTEIIV